MRRMVCLATLAFFVLAAPAVAVPDGLAIAEARWPSSCSGKTIVVIDPTMRRRGYAGESVGIRFTWNGSGWDWSVAECKIAVAAGLTPGERCETEIHEYGHLVFGPDHIGAMAPEVMEPLLIKLCGTAREHRERILREELVDLVRAELPAPVSAWRIKCNVRRIIRCRADSPHARHLRWFRAGIVYINSEERTVWVRRIVRNGPRTQAAAGTFTR